MHAACKTSFEEPRYYPKQTIQAEKQYDVKGAARLNGHSIESKSCVKFR